MRAGLEKRQCSVMAALDTVAFPYHTEANPEIVSGAITITATRWRHLVGSSAITDSGAKAALDRQPWPRTDHERCGIAIDTAA